MKYKLKGINPKYPETIEIWDCKGDAPEWMVDRCFVKYLDENGKPVLDKIKLTSGGYEFRNSDKSRILIRTNYETDVICYSSESKIIFPLREKQLNILYEKIEEK